jgi:hypothetical protein
MLEIYSIPRTPLWRDASLCAGILHLITKISIINGTAAPIWAFASF